MADSSSTRTDIAVTRGDKWLEIEIRRPDKFNAIREQTACEIMEAMADAEDDDGITSVLFCGSPKSFCSGIDTVEFEVGEGVISTSTASASGASASRGSFASYRSTPSR